MMIETYKPDILVNVPHTSCGTFEFYKAEEIIRLGKESYSVAISAQNHLNQA